MPRILTGIGAAAFLAATAFRRAALFPQWSSPYIGDSYVFFAPKTFSGAPPTEIQQLEWPVS